MVLALMAPFLTVSGARTTFAQEAVVTVTGGDRTAPRLAGCPLCCTRHPSEGSTHSHTCSRSGSTHLGSP